MFANNYCPRCGIAALEHLSTHSICWECGYSPDIDCGLEQWRKIEFPSFKRKNISYHALRNIVGQSHFMTDLRT